jgi:shikimate kinase
LKKRSGKPARGKLRKRARSNSPKRSAGSPVTAVFLVGFMGAGKTSVGRALGQRLDWIFEDLDDRIERREGRTVPQIFRDSGESAFRKAEHGALRDLLEESSGSASSARRIIALGGGAFVQKNNASLLKQSRMPIVFLDASVDELWQRCCQQASEAGAQRPLLRSQEQFRKLYQERRKSYAKAFMTVDTGNRTVDEVAAEIAQKLGLNEIPIRIEEGEVE